MNDETDERSEAFERGLKTMERVALELYRRGREPLLAELEEARERNTDLRKMLEQVTRDRDHIEESVVRLETQRDEAIKARDQYLRERDQARLAEERARESLDELDAAIYECLPSDYDDDSPLDCVEHAADQLRALAQERDEARAEVNHWRVKAEAYGGMVDGCGPALEAAGHPIDPFQPDGRIGGIARSVAALVKERDEARAEVEAYERDWYAAKADFGTAMVKMREALRAAEKRELEALAELDEARAEVEHAYREGGALFEAKIAEREAYRRGAEAMREACIGYAHKIGFHGLTVDLRALPIPEDK